MIVYDLHRRFQVHEVKFLQNIHTCLGYHFIQNGNTSVVIARRSEKNNLPFFEKESDSLPRQHLENTARQHTTLSRYPFPNMRQHGKTVEDRVRLPSRQTRSERQSKRQPCKGFSGDSISNSHACAPIPAHSFLATVQFSSQSETISAFIAVVLHSNLNPWHGPTAYFHGIRYVRRITNHKFCSKRP
jgi:hypothetical protein